mgnify:CR=1 FL=1
MEVKLNDMQAQAVCQTEGPLLILAGAGSGKTRVITHRIAYLIEERMVSPWNIMAITFTNKAAAEMRERVDGIVDNGSGSVWVSTFHSLCVRILRRHIDRMGYDTNFTIYDTDDQKTLMKDICKRLNIDTKQYKEKRILRDISAAKNDMITPGMCRQKGAENGGYYEADILPKAYEKYDQELKKNNALDFDDLLVKTVLLFEQCPDVLESYQNRFLYIMVDEYQDTNNVQFRLVELLARKNRNLCVVGDDDQSIYKFRGANIYNILNFEKVFTEAKVIRLEQNYRSTQTILDAANAVISNNEGRKRKRLWTENEKGEKITHKECATAYDEAEYVATDILKAVRNGRSYNDNAVFYRINAQSRILEEKLIAYNIPYRLFGGVNFYARKEIKDVLAYLKTVDNGLDDVATKRIINVPKRGIGATSVEKLSTYAEAYGTSFFEACKHANELLSAKSAAKVLEFVNLIQRLRTELDPSDVLSLYDEILDVTEYIKELQAENTEESLARIENIDELRNKILNYEDNIANDEEESLSSFLEEVALVADIDNYDENADYVALMTIHSAKGLEFPRVYICGMEENLFPGFAANEDNEELEEERRLCYVAITRAMEELTIINSRTRMLRGETQYNAPSRFIEEIPCELLSSDKGNYNPVKKNYKKEEPNYISNFRSKPFGFGAPSDDSDEPTVGFTKGITLKSKPQALLYGVGDRVSHVKYGRGTVLSITDAGRDYEVTVSFDNFGVRKMLAAFSKLIKIQ